jgi:Ran GTPase-activating protein (RanGAP) involved in mRNA processing and transport
MYFPQHQDFKLFYKYIDIMGPHINTLRLKILDKKFFKSNNYYLMALLGRMKNMKILKIHKSDITAFGADGFKFLQKGLKYF